MFWALSSASGALILTSLYGFWRVPSETGFFLLLIQVYFILDTAATFYSRHQQHVYGGKG